MPPAAAALLVVDVQNDFCPGGALAVPAGDRVVAPINRLVAAARAGGQPIFASRDWHPVGSAHFAAGGGPWPVHCVAGTPGAAFHPALRLPADTRIVSKGTAPEADGYSAFDGAIGDDGISLAQALSEAGTTRLVVCGLATDYCVRASVLDARARGLHVSVVEPAVAAVDRSPGAGEAALREMQAAGADLIDTDTACRGLSGNAALSSPPAAGWGLP